MSNPYERPRRPRKNRIVPILGGLVLLMLVAAAVWVFLFPDDAARFFYRNLAGPPEVKSLTLAVNGQPKEIKPGETLAVNALDEITIIGFTSNRWRNVDLTISSPDLDLEAVRRPTTLFKLLGEEVFARPQQFRFQVKAESKVLGDFALEAAMSALDWAALGSQAQDPEKKQKYYRLALDLDPANNVIQEKLAAEFIKAGDHKAAAEVYEKAFGPNPTVENLKRLLTIYSEAGLPAKVDETYQRLIAISPKEEALAYSLDLAELKNKRNQLGEASKIYESHLGELPAEKKTAVLKKLLAIYQKTGPEEKVIETYRRLTATSPKAETRPYLEALAGLEEKRGRLVEAIQAYEALLPRLPSSAEQATVLKKVGFLQAKNKNLPKAIESYEAAAKLDQNDANLFINLTRLYQTQGDKARYRENLAKVAALKPEDDKIRIELVETYLEAGDEAAAEKELKALLVKSPELREARLLLIKILEKRGDKRALSAHYQYLLKSDPDNRLLLHNLAVITYETGDLTEAEGLFKQVVRLDPKDLASLRFLFEIYRRQHREIDAAELAERLITLVPDETALAEYVLDFWEKQGDYSAVVRIAKALSSQHPKVVAYKERQAQALVKLNRLDEALRLYEDLLSKKEGDVELLLKVAKLYEGLGRLNEAQELYSRVLAVEPNHQAAAEALLQLRLKVLEKKRLGR